MRYIILKELIPSMENLDDNFNFIDRCSCIENDEIFSYSSLGEAMNKTEELKSDVRYKGRRFKIKEVEE